MASLAPRAMTLTEFLDWDDGTDTRYELIDGEVVAMTPPMPPHAAVISNLDGSIRALVKPPCFVLVGAGVVRVERANRYFVPDLLVTCTPLTAESRYVSAPRLIVEILSPSTRQRDRVIKLDDYRAIRSVEELLFVSATERRVQLWQRDDPRWIVQDFIGDAEISLTTVEGAISLATIYENATLELEPGSVASN